MDIIEGVVCVLGLLFSQEPGATKTVFMSSAGFFDSLSNISGIKRPTSHGMIASSFREDSPMVITFDPELSLAFLRS